MNINKIKFIESLESINPDIKMVILKGLKSSEYNNEVESKVIDLSTLIDSDIDMEFSNGLYKLWHVEKLKAIFGNDEFKTKNGKLYKFCRIRENHWHTWSGDECPLPKGLRVKVRLANKNEFIYKNYLGGDTANWLWLDNDKDIIAFSVLGTMPNSNY